MSTELNVSLIPERTHKEQRQLEQLDVAQNFVNFALTLADELGQGKTEETKELRANANRTFERIKRAKEQKQPPKSLFKIGGMTNTGIPVTRTLFINKGENVINRTVRKNRTLEDMVIDAEFKPITITPEQDASIRKTIKTLFV